MSLGLEALNSALSCAEVTEITAAELQAPQAAEGDASSPAAERFVGAAVRASLAAAGASNAAMSAAIAAVEGSRQCAKALEKPGKRRNSNAGESADFDTEPDPEEAPRGGNGDGQEGSEEATHLPEPSLKKSPVPTPEQAAAAANQRLVAQRQNNHKVLQRLNAEILGHQRNVREFLRQNRQLIPQVPMESKQKIFRLLRDYATEAWVELEALPQEGNADRVLAKMKELSLLVPFLQESTLAIPVSVKARILKMAALYDLPLTMRLLDEELFERARQSLAGVLPNASKEVDALAEKMREELSNNVAEEGVVDMPGGQTPGVHGGQTPQEMPGRFGNL
jgi:hypothetical protein